MATRISDRGAALISVLLLVAIMSAAALAIAEVTSRSLQQIKLGDAQSQGLWFVSGAEEIGHTQIQLLQSQGGLELNLLSPALTNEFFFASPVGGTMTARLRDASNCFNLNSLVTKDEFDETIGNEDTIPIFRQLLQVYGVTESESESLADALVDWIDQDNSRRSRGAEDSQYIRRIIPYRTSGQLLENISELRAIEGFEADLVQELEQVTCANESPEPTVWNINTLELQHAPLLVAAFSGEISIQDAVNLLDDRPIGGWEAVDALLQDRTVARVPQDQRNTGFLGTISSRLEISGTAVFRGARQNFSVLYSVSSDQPLTTVRRTFGES